MRTRSVRIMPYGDGMINPGIAEALALAHQQELRRSAESARLARRLRATRVHPLRARAGWWLVHAGIRLALTADGGRHPSPPSSGATGNRGIAATTWSEGAVSA